MMSMGLNRLPAQDSQTTIINNRKILEGWGKDGYHNRKIVFKTWRVESKVEDNGV